MHRLVSNCHHMSGTFHVLHKVVFLELVVLFQAPLCGDRGLEVLESVVIIARDANALLFLWRQFCHIFPAL